jgi:hypothetical protein
MTPIRRIGAYEVQSLIGTEGMGQVYRLPRQRYVSAAAIELQR